ncbi:MAG: RNA polymerase sigma factor [Holophagales bacterium]|nr:RNA polymerase sigma factor [Holophagales bacterium]
MLRPRSDPFDRDRYLVARCQDGEREAFDALMERHQGSVYAVAFRMTGSKEDALELSQEVFLRAFRELGTLRDGGLFRAWITSIAARQGANWVRGRLRRDRRLAGPPAGEHVAGAAGEPVPAVVEADAGHRLLRREEARALHDALGALSPKARLALELRYFEELGIPAIAEALEMTAGSVRNLLYRALRRLEQQLRAPGHPRADGHPPNESHSEEDSR